MIDLTKAFETEDGIIAQDTVMPDSVFESIRSLKPVYSGDILSTVDYYNSLIQVDANRIARDVFNYTGDVVTTQTRTYYESDGLTVFKTETYTFIYTNEEVTDIEVS